MYFGLFNVGFSFMFMLIVGIFIVMAVKGLSQWNRNNQSPRLEVEAEVVAKRTNTTHHHDAGNMAMSHTDTTYYVTFQVASGDRMEFHVPGREYGMLVEGDRGVLRFQGTRYLEFERE